MFFLQLDNVNVTKCVSSYLRESAKLLKWEGDDACARLIGTRVAEVEIDDDDDCAAVVEEQFRSLAARALAAKRDDIIERRPEVEQPLVELVELDADCAATERIERKRESYSFFIFLFAIEKVKIL